MRRSEAKAGGGEAEVPVPCIIVFVRVVGVASNSTTAEGTVVGGPIAAGVGVVDKRLWGETVLVATVPIDAAIL